MSRHNLLLILFCTLIVSCGTEDLRSSDAGVPVVEVGQDMELPREGVDGQTEFLEPFLEQGECFNDLSELEDAIVTRAMECNRSVRPPDRALLIDILRYEREYGVPPSMRGMTLVAACHESGFNTNAEGDHKFSKRGKPKAIGILQQWPWWESKHAYGIDRRDPRQAARAWIAHVHRQALKVRGPCGLTHRSQKTRLWEVAWITAIRAPAKRPRCGQTPKHIYRYRKWHKSWAHLVTAPTGDQIASR